LGMTLGSTGWLRIFPGCPFSVFSDKSPMVATYNIFKWTQATCKSLLSVVTISIQLLTFVYQYTIYERVTVACHTQHRSEFPIVWTVTCVRLSIPFLFMHIIYISRAENLILETIILNFKIMFGR
jgi:hypothetical protein